MVYRPLVKSSSYRKSVTHGFMFQLFSHRVTESCRWGHVRAKGRHTNALTYQAVAFTIHLLWKLVNGVVPSPTLL